MPRTLITGANGFVGQALCRMLSQAGHEVVALTLDNCALTDIRNVRCDVRDASAVENAVRQTEPSHVVHLAALTHVPTSIREPHNTWQTNVMGSVNLLEALHRHAPQAFLLYVSSTEVYGASFLNGLPVDETTSCQPANPYAASKLAAESAVQLSFRRGLAGVIARPSNHIGPRQSAGFVATSFARQIALIEAGKQEPVIKVGNLEAQRDFLDLKDVCEAYIRLLHLEDSAYHPRCFNIGSGQPVRIAEILDTLLNLSRMRIAVEHDPERMRPSDIAYAACNTHLLRQTTGWQPTTPLHVTLAELLDYWRSEVAT